MDVTIAVTVAIVIAFAVAVLLSCLLLSQTLSLDSVALRCVISGDNDGGRCGAVALFRADLEAHRCSRPDNLANHFLTVDARHNPLSLWTFSHVRVVPYLVEFLKFELGVVAGSAELSETQPFTMAFPRETIRCSLYRGMRLSETVTKDQANLT